MSHYTPSCRSLRPTHNKAADPVEESAAFSVAPPFATGSFISDYGRPSIVFAGGDKPPSAHSENRGATPTAYVALCCKVEPRRLRRRRVPGGIQSTGTTLGTVEFTVAVPDLQESRLRERARCGGGCVVGALADYLRASGRRQTPTDPEANLSRQPIRETAQAARWHATARHLEMRHARERARFPGHSDRPTMTRWRSSALVHGVLVSGLRRLRSTRGPGTSPELHSVSEHCTGPSFSSLALSCRRAA
jgi:hypothetical protein